MSFRVRKYEPITYFNFNMLDEPLIIENSNLDEVYNKCIKWLEIKRASNIIKEENKIVAVHGIFSPINDESRIHGRRGTDIPVKSWGKIISISLIQKIGAIHINISMDLKRTTETLSPITLLTKSFDNDGDIISYAYSFWVELVQDLHIFIEELDDDTLRSYFPQCKLDGALASLKHSVLFFPALELFIGIILLLLIPIRIITFILLVGWSFFTYFFMFAGSERTIRDKYWKIRKQLYGIEYDRIFDIIERYVSF